MTTEAIDYFEFPMNTITSSLCGSNIFCTPPMWFFNNSRKQNLKLQFKIKFFCILFTPTPFSSMYQTTYHSIVIYTNGVRNKNKL